MSGARWIAATVAVLAPASLYSYVGTAAAAVPAFCTGIPAARTPTVTNTAKPEIVALARSLLGNPDLAYQYVHDNIETLPVQGSLKGPVGAMLDGRGTALDQAELMALVLRVNGVTAAVEYGTRTLSQAEATNWLGVSDTSVIPNILSAGGFTTTYPSLDWAWVAVTVNGTTTYYDPASKAYVQDFGLGRDVSP